MVPANYVHGMYNASIVVYWGDEYKIEDALGTQGRYCAIIIISNWTYILCSDILWEREHSGGEGVFSGIDSSDKAGVGFDKMVVVVLLLLFVMMTMKTTTMMIMY